MRYPALLTVCALLAGWGDSQAAVPSPEDRDLLVYLSRTDEGRDGRMFVPTSMVGFARFCDLSPERRELFEGLAYVRITQESYARYVELFRRECGVQLQRTGELEWIVIRRPEPGERLPRRLAGQGVRVTIMASGSRPE